MALEKPDKKFPSHLESLMTQAPAGFLMADTPGRMLYVNRLIEEMFAYPQAELIGQPVELLIPERFHDDHAAHRISYMKNPSSRKMGKGRDLYARKKMVRNFPSKWGWDTHIPKAAF